MPLDAVAGALIIEEWHIKSDLRTGELELSGLRKRQFTEYTEYKECYPYHSSVELIQG